MKRLFAILSLLCFVFSLDVSANPSLKSLNTGQSLRVYFTQQRYMAELPKPITSNGELLLWNGKGLIWKTKEPFQNTILITKKGLFQIENENKIAMMQAGQEEVIFDMMSVLVSGTLSEIKGFTTSPLQPLHGKWRIRLRPTNVNLQHFLSYLDVEGDKYVSHVTIHRSNGDKDEIHLKNHAVFDKEDTVKILSPNEMNWLND